MKKYTNCLIIGLVLFLASFIALPALAQDNIISSVIIAKAKNGSQNYELSIDSTEVVPYKTHIADENNIYFDLKNSALSEDIGTIYEDTTNIENVIVKQLDNRVRIYVRGKNVDKTEIVFINSDFNAEDNASKKITINRPIEDYQPLTSNGDLEDINSSQDWDDNSFNLSHLCTVFLSNIKQGPAGILLITSIVFITLIVIAKTLTNKITQDSQPLIGLNAKLSDEINNTNKSFNTRDLTRKSETLQNAQEELTRAHQRYKEYLQNKYKNNEKLKFTNPINTSAITKGIALNQYKQNEQNPYSNQSVIKINKSSSPSFDVSNGDFKLPPRPKMQQINHTAPTFTKKNPINDYVVDDTPKKNMKFLESVTKIYEQSGRKDLADELKNSISKAKQVI